MATQPKSDILLDLDELAPPKVQIKFGQKTIEVHPPSLTQYSKIIDFSEKLGSIKKTKDEFSKVGEVYEEIDGLIKELIPELKDTELNFAQLSSLFKLMSEIGAPSDRALAKLKAQGIDLKATGKASKKASASSKQ